MKASRHIKITFVFIIAVFLLFSFIINNNVFCDTGFDRMAPRTSVPFPEINTNITLENVSVVISADNKHNMINALCEFEFINTTNKVQEVVMGFPIFNQGAGTGISFLESFTISIVLDEPVVVATVENISFDDYDLILDNTITQKFTHYKLPDDTDKWRKVLSDVSTRTTFFWKYSFEPGEQQKFIIKYTAENWKKIIYYIGTGGLWKDNIKNMNISIHFPFKVPFHFIDIQTPDCKYLGGTLRWDYREYNPILEEKISVEILDDRWVGQDSSSSLFYEQREVKEADYKLDKNYILYDPTVPILPQDDPEGTKHAIKSPDYILKEVSLLRNEIFARHGYVFNKTKYKDYFSKMSWYEENKVFSASDLNYIEKRNISYFKCIEHTVTTSPPEFKKYFKRDILEYDEVDHDSVFHDEQYYNLERKYLHQIRQCYEKNIP